jgi:DNA polymerase III delta prime subunit
VRPGGTLAAVASAPILLLTGPPGSGKSTVARLVAERFDRSACVESDWFWTTIVRGHVPPWLAEADAQNRAMVKAWAGAAAELSLGRAQYLIGDIKDHPVTLDSEGDVDGADFAKPQLGAYMSPCRSPLGVSYPCPTERGPRRPGRVSRSRETRQRVNRPWRGSS